LDSQHLKPFRETDETWIAGGCPISSH
jgi:hypothetical protein